MTPYETVSYEPGVVRLLDQTQLPARITTLHCTTVQHVIDAIVRLSVRGAPAIGVTAAYGTALASDVSGGDRTAIEAHMRNLRTARPTAVNLGWALDRMQVVLNDTQADPTAALRAEAHRIHEEDRALCERLGAHGASLLPEGAVVMTHCNTGALATGGIGTAFAALLTAHRQGKNISVIANETRPLQQGARLTMWELQQHGIPATLVCDGAAGWTMLKKNVSAVIVGSDRVAANGDVANKIGTYPVAVLAARHGIPFYVSIPYSTLDMTVPTGADIPIEERAAEEVTAVQGHAVAPEGTQAYNPAFDITPADLVTAIVTERGIMRPPYPAAFAASYPGG